MNTPARRELKFNSLDEALAEARRLLESGYTMLGKWDLGQVCGHCADWLRFPADGYPRAVFPISALLWLMKSTLGASMRRKILREERFAAGKPTMPQTVKLRGALNDAAGVAVLEAAAARFQQHSGPWHASPLFGEMTRDEHLRLQLIHLAHHLGFLIPHNQRGATS